MRVLHTGDWHVGKSLREEPRAEEYRAVLSEIAGIVRERKVEVVLVAGDLFDTASPGTEAEEIIYRALLDLAQASERVVVIGKPRQAQAARGVEPLMRLTNIRVLAKVTARRGRCRPQDHGQDPSPAAPGGIRVCSNTVGRLLKKLDFALHVNKKTLSSGSGVDRDRQFRCIRSARKRFERLGLPIISVDTKKREMFGQFKNAGAKWAQAATPGSPSRPRSSRATTPPGRSPLRWRSTDSTSDGTTPCPPGTTPSSPFGKCRLVLASALS